MGSYLKAILFLQGTSVRFPATILDSLQPCVINLNSSLRGIQSPWPPYNCTRIPACVCAHACSFKKELNHLTPVTNSYVS